MSETPTHDPLTGAYTRSTFNVSLRDGIEQARRDGASFSLLVFDLDHFKSINDAFGHAQGDKALIGVARLTRQSTRTSDQFFRYGGDEFVLLLPNTTKTEASDLAQRLLETIRAHPFGKETAFTLTLSIGVATFPEDATDDQALFEKADARNYEAKRRGRARVIDEDVGAISELPFAELSRLVERDDILEAAQNFLAALIDQQHGVFSIVGTTGVGCSRFLVEVEKRARLQGFEVIALHGSPRLKSKPYGVLENILRDSSFTPFPHIDLEKITEVFHRRLSESGRDRLLISVDDLPQLDWGTLDLLRQFLSATTIPILGLVYVSDPDNARVAAPFWTPLSERVTLRPLTSAGLRIWLRILLQWDPPGDFITWLEKQTRGLPLQVEHVLKYMLRQGALTRQDSGWRLGENYTVVGAEATRQWQKRVSPNNLPAALTSFVGRETELKEVRQLLATTRLLTVVGPGGMGKTRLTLQVAKEALNGFKDGVWLVELAPLTDPALVLHTIASVLGVREEQSRPLMDTLGAWSGDKELLFILDNCEHLLDAVAQFADSILRRCPNVRILANSREAMGVEGELAWSVPSLSLPDPKRLPELDQLTQYEAVRLFIDRALLVNPRFKVDEGNAPDIAQICFRLDGIPLAIELASARIRMLSANQIASRLDDHLALLTGGARLALPRQQTLRAAIDWSYELLAEKERLLFCRLGVFGGSWILGLAEQVCSDERIGQPEIAGILERLVDKSLITVQKAKSGARYRILETVRQYAREKLFQSLEGEILRSRHLQVFLHLAEKAEPEIRGQNQVLWLNRLEEELDNLRAGLEWSQDRDIESCLRLSSALWRFWDIRGYADEALAWLTKTLSKTTDLQTETRARALARASQMASNNGYTKQAESFAQEAYVIGSKLNDKPSLARALLILSTLELNRHREQRGMEFLEQSLNLSRAIGDHGLIASILFNFGVRARNRDLTAAVSFMEQGLHEARISGDKRIISHGLKEVGLYSLVQGNVEHAKNLVEEALPLVQEMEDWGNTLACYWLLVDIALFAEDYASAEEFGVKAQQFAKLKNDKKSLSISLLYLSLTAWAKGDLLGFSENAQEALAFARERPDQFLVIELLSYLGEAFRLAGDLALARRSYMEAVEILQKENIKAGYCVCLDAIAMLTLAEGQSERGVRLMGARDKLRESTFVLDNHPFLVRHRAGHIAAARAQLDETVFRSAWEAGRAMSFEEMLDDMIKGIK